MKGFVLSCLDFDFCPLVVVSALLEDASIDSIVFAIFWYLEDKKDVDLGSEM